MDEFSHLADRFKNRFNLGQRDNGGQRWGQGPPPPPNWQQGPPPAQMSMPQPGYSNEYQSAYPGSSYGPPPPASESSYSSPPPVPSGRPQQNAPVPPPRPHDSTRPSDSYNPSQSHTSTSAASRTSPPQAGAVYAPGEYPTPELPNYPLQRHRYLQPSSSDECTSILIQSTLKELGPSSTVYLPPGSVWKIDSTIFLDDFQELATAGYPTREGEMAVLDAQETLHGHILHAFDKSGIRIRNLVIEGNKEKYGWDDQSGVMIQLGGGKAHNQVLDRCVLRNPRHWSCVQAFEGAHNVRITNNAIGPAGVGADKESGRWADGISYAASDGLVAGNLVIDTTDGGIVLFNAPGTLVTSNTVVTKTRLGLGAINMVDYIVENGNFSFTRVTHNTLVTAGSMMKIGIGQGPSVWWQQTEGRKVCRGGTVSHNRITRESNAISHPFSSSYASGLGPSGSGTIGYGFPVGSDIIDWACIDNLSDSDVRYEGDISGTLPKFLNAAPGPFIHDRWGNAEGDEVDLLKVTLQPEFIQGKIWGLLDIKEGPSKVLAYEGGGLTLRKNEPLHMHGVVISLDDDLELRIRRSQDGSILWEAGIAQMIDPRKHGRESSCLHFTPGGKLVLADHHLLSRVFLDITPHISSQGASPSPSKRPTPSRLIFSSEAPYMTITSSTGDLIYGSSYTFGRFSEFTIGHYVARPTPFPPFNGGALIYTMSPQRQFGVAHTMIELPPTLEWPLDYSIFHVQRVIGPDASGDDPKAKMGIQGDGHMLIFDGEGNAVWGSGTHGDRGADKLTFGIGTEAEPYLELTRANGERLWSA